MKNNFKKGFIVPAIIALIVIIAGGVYFYSNSNKDDSLKQVENIKNNSSSKSDSESILIKVISPNGGEVWKIGNAYNISFSVNGNISSKTISLNRYSDDGVKVSSKVIGIIDTNNLNLVYKIPSDTIETKGDAGRYKVEVSSLDKYQDVSDNYFTITN